MEDVRAASTIAEVECFLLDMDGTVYLSDQLIDGAKTFIDTARAKGKKVLFLTNNSSHNVAFYQKRLETMGINVTNAEIMTSGVAAGLMLMRDYPGKRVWVLGNELLKEELLSLGVCVCEEDPEVILVGFDNTVTYRKLCEVCDYVRAGLPYIATHPDFNCPVPGGFIPDLGSFMALIEASTGRKADVVIGKPQKEIIVAAQKCAKVSLRKMAMIGDRLYTDIAAGKIHGLLSVLVLTGETKREDIPLAEYPPDIIVERLGDLVPLLR